MTEHIIQNPFGNNTHRNIPSQWVLNPLSNNELLTIPGLEGPSPLSHLF